MTMICWFFAFVCFVDGDANWACFWLVMGLVFND